MNPAPEPVSLHSVAGSLVGAVVTLVGIWLAKRSTWQQARLSEQESYYRRLHDDAIQARTELDAVREERLKMQEQRFAEREEYAKQIFALQHDKKNLYAKIQDLMDRVEELERRVAKCVVCPHEPKGDDE